VEIAPNAAPPVCRIMNYGKFLYQQSKKAHDARKKQKLIHVKEVKFRPNTDEHDFQFKKKNIVRFLAAGDKVKVTIIFRGRELAHKENGVRIVNRLEQELTDVGTIETPPRMEGVRMNAIFSPRKV
jgi:translation initiation factor IF-3